MTVLANKATRDSLNIDTYERAAVWAAMQLKLALAGSPAVAASQGVTAKAAVAANTKYDKSFRINTTLFMPKTGEPIPVVLIDARLPYTVNTALKAGGDYYSAIKPFGNVTPNAITATLEPTADNALPVVDPPNTVTTLEQYFLWAVRQIKKGAALLTTPAYWMADVGVVDDAAEPLLWVRLQLPIDWAVCAESNVLAAIEQTITSLGSSGSSSGEPDPQGFIPLTFSAAADDNGLFYWLGSNGKTGAYSNPSGTKVTMSASSLFANNRPASKMLTRDFQYEYFMTNEDAEAYIQADLLNAASLKPNYYAIQFRADYAQPMLLSWKLEGFKDNAWEVLDTVTNNSSAQGAWYTKAIAGLKYYTKFKLTQTALNSEGLPNLALSNWEFYGKLAA